MPAPYVAASVASVMLPAPVTTLVIVACWFPVCVYETSPADATRLETVTAAGASLVKLTPPVPVEAEIAVPLISSEPLAPVPMPVPADSAIVAAVSVEGLPASLIAPKAMIVAVPVESSAPTLPISTSPLVAFSVTLPFAASITVAVIEPAA